MELGIRLKSIASMIDKCEALADIGTDHGYIPIYLIQNGVCERAIASDINKGPIKKAKYNIALENLTDKIECRLGEGFDTIAPSEVSAVIVAGMGGNLIRDIIEEGIDVFKALDYAVLQPVQNPEILREYIYNKGYDILAEELCFDEGKFYEIIKVKYNDKPKSINPIYYEISETLIKKGHKLLREYINFKLTRYRKIYSGIKDETEAALNRKDEVGQKIAELEGILKCL